MTISAALPITVDYPSASEVIAARGASQIKLSLDGGRAGPSLKGAAKDPALVRDALLTTLAILESDLRYKGRDRTAYLAYLMKQGKRASAAIWEAQKAYLDNAFADDVRPTAALDPVLTIDDDEVALEVFSRDESAYARLALRREVFDAPVLAHGTACVDLGANVREKLETVRAFEPLELFADSRGVSANRLVRSFDVPTRWLRGFLQVQSAATLPATVCELSPVDLYNILFALRTRKAQNPPRGVRFELVPGAAPRVVIEPWEIVIEGHGAPYRGVAPRVVRTFGRQRLLALAPLLPHIRSMRVHLLGAGLPLFLAFDLGPATLSVALSGWSEASWASAATFDALMPRTRDSKGPDEIVRHLRSAGALSLADLVSRLATTTEETRASIQAACLRGEVVFDIARSVFRARRLLSEAVPDETTRYGSDREAKAHRLLGDGATGEGDVELTKVHEIAGEGVEIQGTVNDRAAHRVFTPRFSLDLEGRAYDAKCNCATYLRTGVREGPCEHMIALRVVHTRRVAEAKAMRDTPEGRKLIRAETRTLVRRDARGVEVVYRMSLDDRGVQVQWGPRNGPTRIQRLWFDRDVDARFDYFRRLDELGMAGYIDAESAQ